MQPIRLLTVGLLLACAATTQAMVPEAPECRWELFLHDDFTNGGFAWSNPHVTDCAANALLGGFNARRDAHPQGETFTHVTGLPAHTHVRIKANMYYLDSWDEEFAYMSIDDHIVWTQDCWHCASRGQNFCGERWPDQLAAPIDIVVPHTLNSFKLAFGSNLNESTRNESYAIGNLMVLFFDCDEV